LAAYFTEVPRSHGCRGESVASNISHHADRSVA